MLQLPFARISFNISADEMRELIGELPPVGTPSRDFPGLKIDIAGELYEIRAFKPSTLRKILQGIDRNEKAGIDQIFKFKFHLRPSRDLKLIDFEHVRFNRKTVEPELSNSLTQ